MFRGLTLAEAEYEHIMSVLDSHQGHRGRAAKALGIDPKTLYNKLKAVDGPEGGTREDSEAEEE